MNRQLLSAATLLVLAGSAQAVRITPAHSGTWFDPAYDKQGVFIEVLDKAGNGPERLATVQWYTYDAAGNPVWAVGLTTTDGDELDVTLQQAFGGARPPAQVAASDLVDFADMHIRFGDCNTATADFVMADGGGSGRYELQRLTQIGATTCTGGISDEVEAGAEPITLVVQMRGAGIGVQAQGRIEFKLRPAYASLEVELSKLPAGSYGVRIGGVDRGQIVMAANGNGNGITQGKFELSSSADDDGDHGLLDFDPRGMLVEIVAGDGSVVLAATLGG